MNQSNVIFAYLFAAFLIFITMRGDLPVYIGLLLGEGGGAQSIAFTDNQSENPPPADEIETSDRSRRILDKGWNLLKSFGFF